MNKRKESVTCDEDCFHCIYPDCMVDILPSENERRKAAYHKRKEKRKDTKKE